MCNNNDQDGCRSIAEILNVINVLQQNANCCGDTCLETCDRGFLGQQFSMVLYNTRPIVLYTCTTGNTPLSMPISKSPTETTTSSIFRLEKLDNCCATFRVLVADTTGDVPTYTSTNSFFTINLDCLCIIRCLDDTNVSDV